MVNKSLGKHQHYSQEGKKRKGAVQVQHETSLISFSHIQHHTHSAHAHFFDDAKDKRQPHAMLHDIGKGLQATTSYCFIPFSFSVSFSIAARRAQLVVLLVNTLSYFHSFTFNRSFTYEYFESVLFDFCTNIVVENRRNQK